MDSQSCFRMDKRIFTIQYHIFLFKTVSHIFDLQDDVVDLEHSIKQLSLHDFLKAIRTIFINGHINLH